MRSIGVGLVCLGLAACAHAPRPSPPGAVTDPPPALPAVEPEPRTISLGELGAEGMSAEWIELQMPADASVLAYARALPEGKETWTLIAAGARRVLRVRWDDGEKIGQAAWAGTANGDAVDLRLVEVRGNVRFASERMSGTCRADKVCEEGKPSRREKATMCMFAGTEPVVSEVAFFAPGKGIDFVVGSCPFVGQDRRARRAMRRDL